VAIVNPKAGNGVGEKRLQKIHNILRGMLLGPVQLTLYKGHAKTLARLFHRRAAGYIVVGGDGTLCEVVQGMDVMHQSVALVPYGTGNSMGRNIGMPTLADTVVAIQTTVPCKIDIISLSYWLASGNIKRFRAVATVGIGYPADTVALAERRFKALGVLCYPFASLCSAFRLPRFTTSLRYDGGRWKKRRLTGLLVNNTKYSGNFNVFPEASMNDAKMDVMELSVGFLSQMLHNLSVLTAIHWYRPARVSQVKRLSVVFDRPRLLMVDGELIEGVVKLEMYILPGVLNCYLMKHVTT
jgi:diacylglycerol kinase family enzyme